MGFPVPNGAELGGVLHVLKERENVSNPLNRRPRQTGWIIAVDEAPEPPVNNVPDLHKESYQKECRLSSHALRNMSKWRLRSPSFDALRTGPSTGLRTGPSTGLRTSFDPSRRPSGPPQDERALRLARDDATPPRLLMTNGVVRLFIKCWTKDRLRQRGAMDSV